MSVFVFTPNAWWIVFRNDRKLSEKKRQDN